MGKRKATRAEIEAAIQAELKDYVFIHKSAASSFQLEEAEGMLPEFSADIFNRLAAMGVLLWKEGR